MTRILPPLNPLRAFEAAARHVNFTHAARELGVTQTAVSRQVAVLESWLKTPLFERRNSELLLTEAGAGYYGTIRGAFEAIDSATRDMRDRNARRTLQIRVCTQFARHWLIPRLPRFQDAHPEVEIVLTTTMQPVIFEGTNLHGAICFGHGQWPERDSSKIFGDALAPLYNPSEMHADRPLLSPSDVRHFPILQSRLRPQDWRDWSAFAGVGIDTRRTVVLDSASLTYEAAGRGAGLAMGQLRLLEPEMACGRLVMPFDCVLNRPLAYYFSVPTARPAVPGLAAFRDWVLDESSAAR